MPPACTNPFHETEWAKNTLTPTFCGAKVFPLKVAQLKALTETVGISQVFAGTKFLKVPDVMTASRQMGITVPCIPLFNIDKGDK